MSRYKSKKQIQTKITTIQDVINDSQDDDLDDDYLVNLNDQIKLGEMILRIEKRKKVGIQPDNLKNNDVRMSFQWKTTLPKSFTEDDNHNVLSSNSEWSQILIIRRDKWFWTNWQFVYTVCCMASSYIYAYMAAFENVFIPTRWEYDINLFFLCFFLITIILNFFVDFKKQGSQ